METFDHIVIGAGIEGLCTALQLAKINQASKKVLLLEQFPFPHERGSSHGQTRIARVWHMQRAMTAMMNEAFNLWRSFEAEGDCVLLTNTGILHIGLSPCHDLEESFKYTQEHFPDISEELPYEVFQKRYPMLAYSTKHKFYLDKTGAVIFANKALQAILGLFKKNGGIFKDMCKVSKIEPGSVVHVHTTMGTFASPSLIICTGPWTNKLLSSLGIQLQLQVKRARVLYWKEKESRHHVENGFPCVLDYSYSTYAVPSIEYPGCIKVSTHGKSAAEPCDPDERENIIATSREANQVIKCIREHFPYVQDTLAVEETCLYTNTPDRMWILDYLPGHKNVVIGTGFSGSGFKAGPTVGKVLAELAANLRTSHDIQPFSLARFN